AIGTDEPYDLTRIGLERDLIDSYQAAKALADIPDIQNQLVLGRLAAHGKLRRIAPVLGARSAGNAPMDEIPHPIGEILQHQDDQYAENDQLIIAALANQCWEQHLQLVLQQLDDAGAGDGSPHVPNPADDGHEQVLDAHLHAKRRGIDRALE